MQSDQLANTSRSSSRSSTRKPKTVGGFIAEDSDEEDDASTPGINSTNLQLPQSNTPNRAISPSPLHKSIVQEDVEATQLPQVDTQPKPQALPAVNLPINPSVATMPAVVAPVSQAPTVNAHALPRTRLPHDKIGILEDRIKEDPRGDVEAWLALITEHRSRNKFDDARAVYERFLKLFPQAVSRCPCHVNSSH